MLTSAIQSTKNYFYGLYWSFFSFGYFAYFNQYRLDGLC